MWYTVRQIGIMNQMRNVLINLGLFALTAAMEIGGCFLLLLWCRQPSKWWFAAFSCLLLMTFAWLLTLHPAASGRVYAAYGGIYIAAALLWLWCVDGVLPDRWDILGGAICIVGSLIIYFGPRG